MWAVFGYFDPHRLCGLPGLYEWPRTYTSRFRVTLTGYLVANPRPCPFLVSQRSLCMAPRPFSVCMSQFSEYNSPDLIHIKIFPLLLYCQQLSSEWCALSQ